MFDLSIVRPNSFGAGVALKAIFGGGCAFALAFMVGAQPVIDSVSIKERLEGGQAEGRLSLPQE